MHCGHLLLHGDRQAKGGQVRAQQRRLAKFIINVQWIIIHSSMSEADNNFDDNFDEEFDEDEDDEFGDEDEGAK